MTTGNLEFIEQLKQQHGAVFQLDAEHADTDEKLTAYFRRPSLPELDKFMKLSKESGRMGGMRSLATDIFVGGDRAVVEHDYTFFSVASDFETILAVKKSAIKKL